MNMYLKSLCMVLTVMASSNAFAVGPDKNLEFKSNSMGTVIFDGTSHKKAGLSCSDCHNPEVFPKMKQGTVKITMNDLYAGKYCGRCHDGKKAFLIKGNCTRCHHEPGVK